SDLPFPPLFPPLPPSGEVCLAHHPRPLAWDLLTLLRAVATPTGAAVGDLEDAPPSWLRALNPSLWNRGPDLPPPGYVEFLGDLARSEDLLTGGDPAIGQALTLGGSMRAWRDRTFWEQSSRLRAAWFSASSWIEGSNREEVDVWGADWTGLRIKLLSHLSALQPDAWYGLDAVAAWLAARDPDLLGTAFTVATARSTDVANGEAATRRAAVAEVASVSLETAFTWFGLVEIANAPRQPRALRLTATGAALAKAQPLPDDAPAPGAAAELADDATVRLLAPTPLRVWSLSAFAEVRGLGAASGYELTQESLARALGAGFEVRQIVAFLTRQLGLEMPTALERRLDGCAKGVRRVRVQRSLTLTPDEPGQRAELEQTCRLAKLSTRIEGGDVLVDIEDDDEAAVWETLRAGGFAPRWARDGRTPPPPTAPGT
ncbi:MAG: helicase-associated domain-containing protein, partial [Thermomicrobiales bacterium]